MITLYATPRGDYAPAPMLTADEAAHVHRCGELEQRDVAWLTTEARRAVALAFVGCGERRVTR